MDEKLLAEQLEQDIDHLLDGHALQDKTNLGQEYNQALESARLLARQDMSHESRIRKSLKQQLLTRMYARKEWSPKQKGNQIMKPRTKLFMRLGVIAAVLATLMALPPVRAFAQNILKQIGPLVIVSQPEVPWELPPADFNPTPVPGGPIIATDQPDDVSDFDAPLNGPTPVPTNAGMRSITPEEALAQLGFKVLKPDYIPNGYIISVAPDFVQVHTRQIASSIVYTTADDAYLSIAQSTFDTQEKFPFSIGDARVIELTIRGQQALFIEDAMQMTIKDENGQNVNLPVDYLLWEENGQFLVINATELTQEEMVKVAESLK